MSRSIPAAIVTALNQKEVTPFYALEMNFDTAPVRLWTGFGDRTIDGETYLGAGGLLAIEGIEEIADLTAKGVNVSLSGISSSIISLALQEPYQGRSARILFGVADVNDFIEVFGGIMDVMTIQHSGDKVDVGLSIESKLISLQRSNIRRYTSESQKLRHRNDTFFDFVEKMVDKELVWGRRG